MRMMKTLAALPAAAACLAMSLAPTLAPLPALAQAPPAPAAQFCLNNRFTNGDFTLTTGSPDAVFDEDIDVATGWEPLWQVAPQGDTSLADLFGPTIGPGAAVPTPASGNYAAMWIANGSSGDIQLKHREGMLNRLTSPIPANSGIYSFTFKAAALGPAATATGVPSVVGIYGVYRAPAATALPPAPTAPNIPTNLDLFGPGNAVLLGQIQIPASADTGWRSHRISFDSASFGSLASISHIMITKADGFPTRTRYVAFDDFCLQAAGPPEFSACCPPWNAARLATMLTTERAASAATPYRIRFAPTAQLHGQMNAYIAYLRSLNIGFTQIGLIFQLSDAGTGAAPSASGISLANVPIHWTGAGMPAANFFNNSLSPNRWYQVRTFIFPAGGPSGFVPANCSGGFIYVHWQPLQGGAAEVLLRHSDGRTDERIIMP